MSRQLTIRESWSPHKIGLLPCQKLPPTNSLKRLISDGIVFVLQALCILYKTCATLANHKPMDLLGGFLPSKGEESDGGSDECAAGPPAPPYPNDSILLDKDGLNESTINDSDATWMPAADVSMDTVLSEMMGIVSAVEVNVDASDVPTVAPNPELDLWDVCGNTPCEFVDYKDEIFDTVIGHLFQAFPPHIDQLNAAVTTPLDQEELERVHQATLQGKRMRIA